MTNDAVLVARRYHLVTQKFLVDLEVNTKEVAKSQILRVYSPTARPQIAVVILDKDSPGTNGEQLRDLLLRLGVSLKFLLCTETCTHWWAPIFLARSATEDADGVSFGPAEDFVAVVVATTDRLSRLHQTVHEVHEAFKSAGCYFSCAGIVYDGELPRTETRHFRSVENMWNIVSTRFD